MVKSIKELTDLAAVPEVDNNQLIRRYISSALKLRLQGESYDVDGDIEMAYVFFMRFAQFTIEMLPRHKDYPSVCKRSNVLDLKEKCKGTLARMEELKGLIETRLAEEERQQQMKADLERLTLLEKTEHRRANEHMAALSLPAAKALPIAGSGSDSWSALKELSVAAPAVLPPPSFASNEPSSSATRDRSMNLSAGDSSSASFAAVSMYPSSTTVSSSASQGASATHASPASSSGYDATTQAAINTATSQREQEYLQRAAAAGHEVQRLQQQQQASAASNSRQNGSGENRRSVKKQSEVIYDELPADPVASSSNSVGVGSVAGRTRMVILDRELFEHFMRIAHSNTSRNVETCGVLTGVLRGQAFYITTLIIPKQTGSSDTCQAIDEDEIFDYQDKNDLITLGWIHTHPAHECFLSSVDLHTQFSYQLMLNEAIAIVMAPKYHPGYGIFSITSSGMDVLKKCPLRGFHHHPENNLFENSKHVRLRTGNPQYKIVDLR